MGMLKFADIATAMREFSIHSDLFNLNFRSFDQPIRAEPANATSPARAAITLLG
jgi:hypothetical protein